MMDLLKPLFFVNACMALAFAAFYVGFRICIDLSLSPYFAAVACFVAYAAIVWREYRLLRASWPQNVRRP